MLQYIYYGYLAYRYAPVLEYSYYAAYYAGKSIMWFVPSQENDEDETDKDWVMCDVVDANVIIED